MAFNKSRWQRDYYRKNPRWPMAGWLKTQTLTRALHDREELIKLLDERIETKKKHLKYLLLIHAVLGKDCHYLSHHLFNAPKYLK